MRVSVVPMEVRVVKTVIIILVMIDTRVGLDGSDDVGGDGDMMTVTM